jgi:hypothetical protein
MTPDAVAVRFDRVSRRFGEDSRALVRAVDSISLEVRRGELTLVTQRQRQDNAALTRRRPARAQ